MRADSVLKCVTPSLDELRLRLVLHMTPSLGSVSTNLQESWCWSIEERALLALLIKNMKLEFDESKKINKSLKKANTSLATELERYKDMKCVKEAKLECAKAFGLLEEHRIEYEKSLDAYELKCLKKAQSAKPCLYDLVYKNNALVNKFARNSDEIIRLAIESQSKLDEIVKPFVYTPVNNLYKTFVPQQNKSAEQIYFSNNLKMSDTPAKALAPTVARTAKIVVNFKQTLKDEMVKHLRYFNSLEKEVESLQTQLELQRTNFSNKNNRLLVECYYNDHLYAILRSYDVDHL
ncbi:hypothetical protein Tco_0290198 [Tanacetum coccineum]